MNNILVTGAAGYIGSMLCTKLVENKKNFVTAVDLLSMIKTLYLIFIKIRILSLLRKI